MPFGPYADFDDCVAQNGDKSNPAAYCAAVEEAAKGAQAMRRVRMALTPITLADENGDGIDDITGLPRSTKAGACAPARPCLPPSVAIDRQTRPKAPLSV
jgi:hypothetical protein